MPPSILVRLDADFIPKICAFYDACTKGHGLRLSTREGYRDPARSTQLYNAWVAGGKVGPRAAPGGRSAHNYGMAVDFAALDLNGRAIPSSLAPEYGVMEEIA